MLLFGCVALMFATYALYYGIAHAPDRLFALYALAGFCAGLTGVIPVLLVQAFPPAVRFSGISFAYNIAYAIFGGMTPLLVTLAMRTHPFAPAHYVAALCLIGAGVAMFIGTRRSWAVLDAAAI